MILFAAIALIVVTAFFLARNKNKRSRIIISCIIAIGLAVRIFGSLDPYLHQWDEKYHALVGKNLTSGIKKPVLYAKPVHEYDIRKWTENHIWLEKGPIPLSFIGYSTKLFGYHPFPVRIPSIIIGTLSIFLTFLISRQLFNLQTAYFAAFLHAINGLIVELNVGRISSDHVETLFIFLVQLSFYVMLIFFESKRNKTLISLLFGLIIGLGLITKWAPALLPLPIFFVLVLKKENKPFQSLLKYGFFAVLGIIAIVSPFVILMSSFYPEEFAWVMKKFVSAYSNTVDNHEAPWWYYINKIGVVFGETSAIILIISLITTAIRRNWQFMFLNLWWLIPVLIFSFAETKRATYLLIAAPSVFIIIGYVASYLLKYRNIYSKKVVKFVLSLFIFSLFAFPLLYSFERVKPLDSNFETPNWMTHIEKMKKLDLPKETIILSFPHHIEAMYHTDFTVYNRSFSKEKIKELISKGYRITFFNEETAAFTTSQIWLNKF